MATRWTLARLTATLLATALTAHAELQVMCEINGRQLPLAKVERHVLWVQDGNTAIAAPAGATWTLVGDLRANSTQVLWSPKYAIEREDAPDARRSGQERPYSGWVYLNHSHQQSTNAFLNEVLREWPDGISAPSAVVQAWVVDGRVVQCVVRPVPLTSVDAFRVFKRFDLTAAEANGQPIELLWSNGHFIAPRPRFSNPGAQGAYVAALFDDADALNRALAQGVSASETDRSRVPLLQYASEAGAVHCVDTLLRAGAKTWKCGMYSTPLNKAVQNHRTTVVERLLRERPNLHGQTDNTDLNYEAPLAVALNYGHEDLALRLIAAGADYEIADASARTPLSIAFDAGMAGVAETILNRGVVAKLNDDRSARVVITQAMLGHTGVVKILLAHGARPEFEERNVTALIAGAVAGDPLLAQALLKAGAHPGRAAQNQVTPLMAAALKDRVEYAQVLLDAGADPNAAMKDGTTALALAARHNAVRCATLLLARGAHASSGGGAPAALEIALDAHAKDVVPVLVAAGARLNPHDKALATRLVEAIAYDLDDVVDTTCASGWSPNTTLFSSWTPLALARFYHAERCTAVLARRGADANANPAELVGASQLDSPLRPISIVQAADPRDEAKGYARGEVLVEGIVAGDGLVYGPRVLRASDPELIVPAIAAFRGWRFSPPTHQRQPAAVRLQLPIVFPSSDEAAYETWELDSIPMRTGGRRIEVPHAIRRLGQVSNVEIEYIVRENGHTDAIRVLNTSSPELEQAIVSGVAKWIFTPGQLDGRRVPTRMHESFVWAESDR